MTTYLPYILAAANPPPWLSALPPIILIALLYLILVRPQNKKMKDHRDMVSRLKAGDKIVTNGGLYATISKVRERELDVKLNNKFEITIARAAVARVRDTESDNQE